MTTEEIQKASDIFESNIGKLHTAHIPQNGIAKSGMPAIQSIFYTKFSQFTYSNTYDSNDETMRARSDYLYAIYNAICKIWNGLEGEEGELEEYEQWGHWAINGKAAYVGTWPKRFKSYLYKECDGLKILPEDLSIIGETISRHSLSDNQTYHFELAHYCDWQAGDFQESDGSCWWSDYENARYALIENGGGAILFYENPEEYKRYKHIHGVGRAWYWPDNETGSVYIFNAYGVGSLLEYARILSNQFGLSYRKVNFDYEHAYVNGDSAYELFTGESRTLRGYYTLNLSFAEKHYSSCHRCGDDIDDEDDCYTVYDDDYCESCYNYLFSECWECDNVTRRQDLTEDWRGHDICESCLEDNYFQCDHCGEYVPNEQAHSVYMEGETCKEYDDSTVCNNCLQAHYTACESCHTYYHDSDMQFNGDSLLCQDCYDDKQAELEDAKEDSNE